MAHIFVNDIPGVPELYSGHHVLNAQDIDPFFDGDDGIFSTGLVSILSSEKEHVVVERQLQSIGGLSFTDFNSRVGFQFSEQQARSVRTPLDHWKHHGNYEEQELNHDAYSSPPTSSRSPCFSDDLSDDSLSSRSSISSQCDMSSSWSYPNSLAPYTQPAIGYPGTEYTSESISLSSIQAFSDLPESSTEHHDYSYFHGGHQALNGVPGAGVGDTATYLSVQPPEADETTDITDRRKRVHATTPLSAVEEDNEDDSDYKPSRRSAGPKRRRRLSNSATGASQNKARGHRRTPSEKVGLKRKGTARKPKKSDPLRPFPCPLALYGCGSTFTSKNEWKRHVSTQHVKLGFWRCDLCPLSTDPANPVYNDFNRKDLFTQHIRRMHTEDIMNVSHVLDNSTELKDGNIPDNVIAEQQSRCYRHLRSHPIRSRCLFCPQVFEGIGSWEQRMEHLGAHFEREKKNPKMTLDTSHWKDDPELQKWFLQEGLIERDNKGGWRIGDGQPRRPDNPFGEFEG